MSLLSMLSSSVLTAAPVPVADVHQAFDMGWAGLILWLPLLSLIACGCCAMMRCTSKLPAWITVGSLAGSFVTAMFLYLNYEPPGDVVNIVRWIDLSWVGGGFEANISFYIDSLSLLWILFVTGLGTLIAFYASEYMETDLGSGYCRFFAGVSVFLFAMSALVLADNLVLLYLGWEGVGFASYWLIGYYYTKPEAVAAAKKAFIVNRIGDLGLALAVYLCWTSFGTVQYDELVTVIESGDYARMTDDWSVAAIPWLLMLAAFGKSAQLPLYVWLPDAMEGPTPVSALIHAATMVTAGIYLLARMYPVFLLDGDHTALHVVAWVGGLTALLAATIGMAQYDIKRIMAYSTVSQLGYMFMGLGVLTTYGAAYHVFTHAFFKAALFLTCGAVMHGFAGQLDLRKLSGLRHMKGWKITSYAMLIGCLCLAGFPFTSGYFSKDAILAEAFVTHGPGFQWLGFMALFTAGLTAYYTFRVWFRVCAGPVSYEAGDDHHGDDHGHDDGHFHPHAPRFAMNSVMAIIAIGALVAAVPYFMDSGVKGGWIADMVNDSTASEGIPAVRAAADHAADHAHGSLFGYDPHVAMYWVSGGVGFIGIAIAAWLHLFRREDAVSLRRALLSRSATAWLPRAMERKWYVDEIYHALIRAPLWVGSHVLHGIDRILVDMVLVDGTAKLPRLLGRWVQPLTNGTVHASATAMAGGVALLVIVVLLILHLGVFA
ncbi:MAG: NADH-quinone oxidoreductase subunit L [Phycisphaerales bacterium]|nr:NADH-quinone oxidoreductase subunit L [Phycisphaerales bacterium]